MQPLRNGMILTLLVLLLGGCGILGGRSDLRSGASSSLVDYLYPGGEIPPDAATGPLTLQLPARVGIAFVPAKAGGRDAAALPEALKYEAIERVRQAFGGRAYIKSIQVVPESYLRHGQGGFATLEQLGRLYGADVMALVSYDQVSVQSDTRSSLLYWTIAGALVVKGNRLETSSFVDTAVLDVRSRRLLFRAAGADLDTRRSNLMDSDHDRRQAQQQSFAAAMQEMTLNLDVELERFRERAQGDRSISIVTADGRTGGAGGATGPGLVIGLWLPLLCRCNWKRRPLWPRRSQRH